MSRAGKDFARAAVGTAGIATVSAGAFAAGFMTVGGAVGLIAVANLVLAVRDYCKAPESSGNPSCKP